LFADAAFHVPAIYDCAAATPPFDHDRRPTTRLDTRPAVLADG
jgi:hypothetical protein